MILTCGMIVALVFLGLRAGFLFMRPPQDKVAAGSMDSIVELSDGSVLVAQPGTISRAVIDWFNNESAPPKTFDIGWEAFEPNSIEPAAESQVRLERFAGEMRANHEVTARLLVCTPNRDVSAVQLARSRANRLMQILIADRIEPTRISAMICRLPDAPRIKSAPSSQNGEVIEIVLEHSH